MRRRGYSLLELVIALALSAIVVMLVGTVFVGSLSTWRRGEELRDAQIQASTLVDLIARDVRNASQATSVLVRPDLRLSEGEPVLAVAAPPASGADPAWILYVHLPDQAVVLRQVVAVDAGGRVTPRDSRAVGTGVVKILAEPVGDGVTIQVEVKRGRSMAEARTTSAPRNP